MRKPKITAHQIHFVTVWSRVHRSGGTIDDVAREIGNPKDSVSAYATMLRRRGHRIDTFRPGPQSRKSKSK